MKKYKAFLRRILFPPLPVVWAAAVFGAVWLIYSFVSGDPEHPMTYGSYAFSAYALTVVCARLPRFAGKARAIKGENPYLHRYFADDALRMTFLLHGTVILNGLYGLLQLGFGLWYHSLWFYSLAGYYLLLAVIRFFLLRDTKKSGLAENLAAQWQRHRFCGIALLLLNLVLAVMFTYITWQNRGFSYHEIVTIALATYTFASLAVALRGLVKYRRSDSPLLSASKYVGFTAAIVSFLPLETAMISAFGSADQGEFRLIITAVSGMVICLAVLFIAVGMITRSAKELQVNKNEDK